VFQTTVKPTEIVNLLGHDPRSKNWKKLPSNLTELYEHLQRKTEGSRSKSTARYIEERIAPGSLNIMLGAFPAISIGMVSPPSFKSYDETGKTIDKAIGFLEFDLSASNVRVLLDGLARITGAMDLIDEGKDEAVNCFTFPVTIYAPTEEIGELSVRQLGQIFHDFNFLATPVAKNLAIALDQSDLYITLTRKLADSPVIASRGGMAERTGKISSKSKALIAQQYFLKFVRGACEGHAFQKTLRDTKKDGHYLTHESFGLLKASLENFLEGLASRMGEEFEKRDYIHLSPAGLCALGLIFHDVEILLKGHLSDDEKERVLDAIAKIDWSRSNQDWGNFLGQMEPDVTGKKKLSKSAGGGAAIIKLTDYIREKAGLKDKLKLITDSQIELGL
jgi:DGQHR domain-containing protein